MNLMMSIKILPEYLPLNLPVNCFFIRVMVLHLTLGSASWKFIQLLLFSQIELSICLLNKFLDAYRKLYN
jgi:hypothetical protein